MIVCPFADPQTQYYAVAVVRKGSNFQLSQIQGMRSCHTGLNRSAGWNVPVGILRPYLNWTGPPKPLQKGEMAGALRVTSGPGLYSASHTATLGPHR